MSISIELSKQLPEFLLQSNFSLEQGDVLGVMGPSGSGKSTLLRSIAGLTDCDGSIIVGQHVWQDATVHLPTHLRDLGMVFQKANLLPHLNVHDNLLFAYQRKHRLSSSQQVLSLEEAIDWFDLANLLKRDVAMLSGGEQQRVALARALLTQPNLLLLDEPMSALDISSKQELLPYLEKIKQRSDLPIIYVAHDLDEIFRIADQLMVLERGQVIKHGPIEEVLLDNNIKWLPDRDVSSLLIGTVTAVNHQYRQSEVMVDQVTLNVSDLNLTPSSKIRLRIFAKDVSISISRLEGSSIANSIAVSIVSISEPNDTAFQTITLSFGQQQLLSQITQQSINALGLSEGMDVWANIKSVALIN
ncbi:MAG: molybdenum ABC transporter ATP-binding protein [Kangiellaceae bacterium]|jgi:molybdate transport system ATP-binding protein|nr:molybdenum ABC transporter ATP-binding protein [Kangiellaceae bacterium]